MPPWPAWEAPALVPDWRPICPSLPFLICSSVKFLSFLVAVLGPSDGPLNSGWFWVALAREKRQSATWGRFRPSNRSGVWKTSSSGTPYFFAAARKDCTFSISRKAGPFSLNFLTLPGWILLISLQSTTPSFRTSPKSPAGSGSPITPSTTATLPSLSGHFLLAFLVLRICYVCPVYLFVTESPC